MMDSLKELARVVSKNKIKKVPTLNLSDRGSRVFDFYTRILDDQFSSEAEAAEYYYNDPNQRSQMRKLKSKLVDRLHNTLFFIDINNPKFSTAQRTYYQCAKELMVIKILTGRSARKAAYPLAKKTLKNALRYELTDIVVELLRFFKSYHAVYTGDLKAYGKIAKELIEYQEILAIENLAVDYYEDINIHFEKHLNPDKRIRDRGRYYIKELTRHGLRIRTFRLHLNKFWLSLLIEGAENNFVEILNVCNEAIRFFGNKKYFSQHFLGVFYYHKLSSLAILGDFKNGQRLARKCLDIYEEGTVRWFRSKECYLNLCMHTRRYSSAAQILADVQAVKEYDRQFESRKEKWRTNHAYLYYLHLGGRLAKSDYDKIKSFRLKKYLNEVPHFSLDKRGYHVPILIVQMLILVQEGKYEDPLDRIEAIEKYSTRYLRRDSNFRSNCFIKMLLQVPKRNFHRVAVERHAKTYVAKLEEEPINKTNQSFEMEIIPYEHLWEYVLESLDNKFH